MQDQPAETTGIRKIIHVDMDAFYASVEQRDNPELRGKPIAVGGSAKRGVVAAASYEARRYGVRSAMPSITAHKRCPQLIFVPPRFDVYREISHTIRAIFQRYTDLIEPLALDEAYLDVSDNKLGITSATEIANAIRLAIFEETQLTASAGVSYNKFLAKLASEENKPNGQFVIKPEQGAAFVAACKIEQFHGVGPRTAERMHELGIFSGADLALWEHKALEKHFGKMSGYLYNAARGVDHRSVKANRERKSLGAERTFASDINDPNQLKGAIRDIADELYRRRTKAQSLGKTLTLKIKYADFELISRQATFDEPLDTIARIYQAAELLVQKVLPLDRPVRLVGLSLSGLIDRSDELGNLQLTLDL